MNFLGDISIYSFFENENFKTNYLTHICLSHQGTKLISNQSHTTLK
jgi:hypothetical protein